MTFFGICKESAGFGLGGGQGRWGWSLQDDEEPRGKARWLLAAWG